ncbi:ankyrin repeat-containing domain protein [Schizothecium vesticola]|uniref:Ankyrin repeat-containing domain protein n=1 Tax=Schizothecium vesticola TaxID=314040 RepID=A0AA40FBU4_9PEZI|nr:ankyrin repeat-containing domain protein [Schizothecium vesticola]
MDPLSVTAGVVGILDTVSKLGGAIYRFRQDYKCADEDLNVAREHALLLRDEIQALETQRLAPRPQPTRRKSGSDDGTAPPIMDDVALEKAMATARHLLSDIETAFPLRVDPHTWRSKARWAMKDKKLLEQLYERLQTVETTLQGIVSMEQLRLSRVIYGMLIQQQTTMDKIEMGELLGQQVFQMAVISQGDDKSTPTVLQARLDEIEEWPSKGAWEKPPDPWKNAETITRPSKYLPSTTRFNRWGFSAHLVALPGPNNTIYRAAVHVSLLGKMYSVQLRLSTLGFPFALTRKVHVRNVVPNDSAMALACRAGNFDKARTLLTSNLAHGSDVTAAGWPMLDFAIESGSSRLVRLLLDHGADPDLAYGEHSMTALQSSFLRNKLDIARILVSCGADLEHVDSDGYSVLSYLWIVDSQQRESTSFMQLLLSHSFSEVNACDERGWTAFHRAAAIGTREDVQNFLRLGASLDLRAEWYGWTALFFAASHDNVDTFQAIVEHSRDGIFGILDGDGWTLLHCAIYFGAPRVMRIVLRNGIDVNQKTLPSPLTEDPELSYRELTASDIALYIGPDRYGMFMDALADTGRDGDLDDEEVFWDASDGDDGDGDGQGGPVYGAEDVQHRWTTLHWASYNGSPKIKRLLLLKGVDPKNLEAIKLEDNLTLLPVSPFEGRY